MIVKTLCLTCCLVSTMPAAELPAEYAAALPKSCSQVLYVVAANDKATSAELYLIKRTTTNVWKSSGAAIPVRIGRSGLAWGAGEPALPAPAGYRIKQEGDGCAPAGIFRITYAFGAKAKPAGIKLPYTHCTEAHAGVDDGKSRFYNQIVDRTQVTVDWISAETMIPSNGCYEFGTFIAHNPRNKAGLGSCIFLHVWQGENIATSGCTAMSLMHLRQVLLWLDPTADPRLIQHSKLLE